MASLLSVLGPQSNGTVPGIAQQLANAGCPKLRMGTPPNRMEEVMGFRLSGLAPAKFEALFHRSDEELRGTNVLRLAAEPGSPCRIGLRDAEPGEPVLLLSYEHQEDASPYRSSGPIFVRQGAREQAILENRIPAEMRARLYSVRGYDEQGIMVDADVAEGSDIEDLIERLFADARIAYLHLHHARRGCYACRVDRA